MSILLEERWLDSPYVETVIQGHTASAGFSIRPAEPRWHMVITKYQSTARFLIVGPWETSGRIAYPEGAEILWIRFKLGTFIPHLPLKTFLNTETTLPEAPGKRFWLKGSAWQLPNLENADTFVDRLVRTDVLANDPVVSAALQNQLPEISPRTLRHRFLQATGLSQNHIRQVERAKRAEVLLRQGVSISDTGYQLGYFDQPHLTRSLKQWIGHTPAQIVGSSIE
ncbi:MAG: helix-turn-helix transcriptional regulator [Thermaceae bacterium]|nr:helix-turn-helix transcriptional regulator [Thermaceae bacterium]